MTYQEISWRNFKHVAEISECCRRKCSKPEIGAVVCGCNTAALSAASDNKLPQLDYNIHHTLHAV